MEEMMELEEIETGRRTEEPLNRDNAFIIAALSFIPRTGGRPPSLSLSFFFLFFYAFFGRKGSIVVEL